MSGSAVSSDEFHPGQLVMVNIHGTSLGAAQAAFLRKHRIRAVALFRNNLSTEAEGRQLVADLREVMGEGPDRGRPRGWLGGSCDLPAASPSGDGARCERRRGTGR